MVLLKNAIRHSLQKNITDWGLNFLGICHVLWDGPLLSREFTAKCPRTHGAAYYSVQKKILQTSPWGLC